MASLVCVLLVDDEPLILETMAECLRDAGFEVVEAQDGVQAVAFLEQSPERFSILVTDFHMPGGLDGAEVASRVRKGHPCLPVVIATGRPDVMRRIWHDELGYTLLRKPYMPGDLIALVRQLVHHPR